jgi:hypothetical protein
MAWITNVLTPEELAAESKAPEVTTTTQTTTAPTTTPSTTTPPTTGGFNIATLPPEAVQRMATRDYSVAGGADSRSGAAVTLAPDLPTDSPAVRTVKRQENFMRLLRGRAGVPEPTPGAPQPTGYADLMRGDMADPATALSQAAGLPGNLAGAGIDYLTNQPGNPWGTGAKYLTNATLGWLLGNYGRYQGLPNLPQEYQAARSAWDEFTAAQRPYIQREVDIENAVNAGQPAPPSLPQPVRPPPAVEQTALGPAPAARQTFQDYLAGNTAQAGRVARRVGQAVTSPRVLYPLAGYEGLRLLRTLTESRRRPGEPG